MAHNDYLVYGGDLMLFVAASGLTLQPIAFSQSASISISMDTREISSKDSVGDYKDFAAGKLVWTISSDALVNYSTSGNTQSVDDLFTLMTNKTLLDISFASKTGTSPSWTVDTNKKRYTGKAYITSLDMTAGDNDNATFSVNLQGVGLLSQA